MWLRYTTYYGGIKEQHPSHCKLCTFSGLCFGTASYCDNTGRVPMLVLWPLMQAQAHLAKRMAFRPSSITSAAHKRLKQVL